MEIPYTHRSANKNIVNHRKILVITQKGSIVQRTCKVSYTLYLLGSAVDVLIPFHGQVVVSENEYKTLARFGDNIQAFLDCFERISEVTSNQQQVSILAVRLYLLLFFLTSEVVMNV